VGWGGVRCGEGRGPLCCLGAADSPHRPLPAGFAIADVNYGGSTGYGRPFRRRLAGSWGVVDVDDCCNAARHLAAQGAVDPARLCIDGGSAGGYTTLACLAFR
jgi:dipeptidyl aminopeptidase/acylaminoacyl peptidase